MEFWDTYWSPNSRQKRETSVVLIDLDKKKQTYHPVFFYCYCTAYSENKRQLKDRRIYGPWQRREKSVEHVCQGKTNCNSCVLKGPQELREGIGENGNLWENRDHRAATLLRSARIHRGILKISRDYVLSFRLKLTTPSYCWNEKLEKW